MHYSNKWALFQIFRCTDFLSRGSTGPPLPCQPSSSHHRSRWTDGWRKFTETCSYHWPQSTPSHQVDTYAPWLSKPLGDPLRTSFSFFQSDGSNCETADCSIGPRCDSAHNFYTLIEPGARRSQSCSSWAVWCSRWGSLVLRWWEAWLHEEI